MGNAPTLEDLADKLKELDTLLDDSEVRKQYLTDEGFIGQIQQDPMKTLVAEIEVLAEMTLIVNTGDHAGACRWDRHNELHERWGYRVGPGEQGSSGWLSGIIYGKNFKIVYC